MAKGSRPHDPRDYSVHLEANSRCAGQEILLPWPVAFGAASPELRCHDHTRHPLALGGANTLHNFKIAVVMITYTVVRVVEGGSPSKMQDY